MCYLAVSAIIIIIFVMLCTLRGVSFLFCLFCLVSVCIIMYYLQSEQSCSMYANLCTRVTSLRGADVTPSVGHQLVESVAGTPDEREASVHASATTQHNSSSYKAQEARRATTGREDRLRTAAVAVRNPVRLVSTRAATSGTPVPPHQPSGHVAGRRPSCIPSIVDIKYLSQSG